MSEATRAGSPPPTLPDEPAPAYDGVPAAALARRLALPAVHAYAALASTQDVAHALAAAGAPAGTLVVAERQRAGRGQHGRTWRSESHGGVWLTLIERPAEAEALVALSLRLGLAVADALEPFTAAPPRLKWPNDVHLPAGKVAGVLVEARWRDARPDWVALGVGVNVEVAPERLGAGLDVAVARVALLTALVPRLRAAAARRGALDAHELAAWSARDLAEGRGCAAPVRGTVVGISPGGALRVRTPEGALVEACHGSLVLDADGHPEPGRRPEREEA